MKWSCSKHLRPKFEAELQAVKGHIEDWFPPRAKCVPSSSTSAGSPEGVISGFRSSGYRSLETSAQMTKHASGRFARTPSILLSRMTACLTQA